MNLNDDFCVQEYVPKSTFDTYGAAFCLRFIDERILNADTLLKKLLYEHYCREVSVTINNWLWGGNRQYRFQRTACRVE